MPSPSPIKASKAEQLPALGVLQPQLLSFLLDLHGLDVVASFLVFNHIQYKTGEGLAVIY